MRAFFIFIVLTFMFLAGCRDNNTPNAEVTSTNTAEIQDVEETADAEGLPKEPIMEEEVSKEIRLIDPYTKELIASITPEDLGLYTDKLSYETRIKQLAKVLAQGTESKVGYDQRMQLDRINENGELIEGQPMIILKESELVERILAVSSDGGDVELPLYTTETGYNRMEFNTLDEVIISSFTTYFNPADIGRTNNIRQSSEAISNVIVGMGDYFSFNTTVGPRTIETGYQEALEIVNGEFVVGIGGGICQTSSTLFNAVDAVGVTLVERHHHSRHIGYVPKGLDATVSYGTLDFRFQNTTGIPIMITSKTGEDSITVEIRTSQKYADQLESLTSKTY